MLLMDAPAKRIVAFQWGGTSGVLYTSYPFNPQQWVSHPTTLPKPSEYSSLGLETVAGFKAHHYRIAREDDSVGAGSGFPAFVVVDVWMAGPETLLDEYFTAMRQFPVPVTSFDENTQEIKYTFEKPWEDAAETAVKSRYHEVGRAIRMEARLEFHGTGIGLVLPSSLDPFRIPPADASADTVRSVLMARDALASLRRASIPDADLEIPQGAHPWKAGH